jgi:hypothetical protein
VEEGLSAANSANATLFTVEYFLLQKLIVKEFAHIAIVPCKLDPARLTLWFDLYIVLVNSGNTYILNMRAYDAFYFFCCKAIELMSFLDVFLVQIFCVIMAEATRKKFVALFTLLHASSLIVSTSMLHHLIFLLCSIIISFDFFRFFTFRRFFLFLNLLFAFFPFNNFFFSALLVIIFPILFFNVNFKLILFWFLLTLRWPLLLICVVFTALFLLLFVFFSFFVIIYSIIIMLIDYSTSIECRKVKCSREIVTH